MRRQPLRHVRCATFLPALLLIALAAASVAGSSGAAGKRAAAKSAAAATALPGLVGAYAFDENTGTTVADNSGAANPGTLSGATWTAGKTGAALSFDGVNDWVTIADKAALDLSSGMTLEAWVKPTAQDAIWRTIVTKETSGNLTYGLFSNSDTSRPAGVATIGSSQTQSIVRGTAATAAGPTWTHLATTYDGSTLRLYSNGTQVGSQPVTGSMANSSGSLRIGGNAVWAEWFSGQIDDLRIYDRPLTAAELQSDMTTPVGATPPPADTQAPSAPGSLAVSGQTATQITLRWSASTDNVGVTGYTRYRNGTVVSSGTGTSFAFTGLVCGTSYALAVDAYDAAGNRSTRPSVTASTLPCAVPSALVAAYSFNAGSGTSLADSSGSGNNGTISGATWTTAGRSGGALTFDGVNDLVTIADRSSLDLTTGMTLEAWIRPTANTTWRTVVTKEMSGNLVYGLFSNSDTPQPSSIMTIGSNPIQEITRGTTEAPLLSWSHLATTYDGSVLRLYVNGVQVSSKNVTGAMANSAGPLQIGGNNIWSEWFQGQIDDLRVYNGALSAAQIQTDMNTPVAPPPPPPPADAQAPSAPGSLSASGQAQTQITLNWSASSDNVGVTGYSYYRGGSPIGNGTGTSYTFTGLSCGTSYALAVDAYDAAGNRSTRPSLNASTTACSPPPPPPAGGSANVWVDVSGGSCLRQASAGAYSDLQACGSLQAAYSVAAAGDTVNIVDGSYGGQTLASGTKVLTFRAAGPGRPSFGHFVSAASNITVRGILIEDRSERTGTCANASYGVLNPCSPNQTYDNVIVDGLNTGDKHGIESPGDGLVFKNGEVRNILNQKGFEGGASDMLIENNVWRNITVNNSNVHNECMFVNGGSRSIYRGNLFLNCPTMALFFTNWNGGPAYRDVIIENNVFGHTLDAGGGWHSSCAFKIGWGYNNQNTVHGWIVRYNTFETGPCIDGTPAGGDNGAGQWYGNLGGIGCAAEWVYRYNVGQTCGGTGEFAVSNAVNSRTSPNVAPFYVNAPAGDFHLKAGAAAIDRGLPGSYPATDRDGKARPVGPAADNGAYEFG